ncbi:ATP-binding protein [Candidatus Peregrinibacteria bacterium]|nr:ATP-binding protein [Candidatus Peregrinibacteria bacterium]
MISRLISIPQKNSFFLFGPRQTGKSTLIRSILPKNSWSVDLLEADTYLRFLKDPSLFRLEVLHQIERNGVKSVFVDEIQKVPLLLDEIHGLIEKTECRFIMTGSSARKLKRGAANLLAGRAVQRFLAPFIYPEIKSFFRLEEILRFGTLPAIWQKEESIKIDTLQAYANTYLKEEIHAEGIVRNLAAFAHFLEIAASAFGEMVNYSNIGRECGLPARSVQGYYDILEDTLIGFRLPAWNRSARKRLRSHPKFYFFDNGAVNSLNHLLRDEISRVVRGRLFEQWIINEVRTQIQYGQKEYQLYYWQTSQGAEVDLLITKHQKFVAAIEIKTASKISGAHFSGLRQFKKEYPDTPAYIVCEAPQPYELERGMILPWKIFLEEVLQKILV